MFYCSENIVCLLCLLQNQINPAYFYHHRCKYCEPLSDFYEFSQAPRLQNFFMLNLAKHEIYPAHKC